MEPTQDGFEQSEECRSYSPRNQRSEAGTINSAEQLGMFELPGTIDLRGLRSFNDPQALSELKSIMMKWHEQICQVLTECDHVKKVTDDSGLLAQVCSWKCLSEKLNFILHQVKGADCRALLGVLHEAQAFDLIKKWKEIEYELARAACEATGTIDFLRPLSDVFIHLTKIDPVITPNEIATVIKRIELMQKHFHYYNSPERISSLLILVTNQMVTASKTYITDNGSNGMWEQNLPLFIQKKQVCTRLLKAYKDAFQHLKKLNGEEASQFSEVEIFGKFEAFCIRLEKIEELLATIESFTPLMTSKIKGIDSLATQFQNICLTVLFVQNKPEDIFDSQPTAFDRDVKDFKMQIHNFEFKHLSG